MDAMKRSFSIIAALCCTSAWAAVPLVVVPEGGRAALGSLPNASGASMPAAETSAFLSRKDGALVFEVVCREPRMERISAKAEKRDEAQVWKDDCVELFIQPKGSADYIHVAVNPLGTIYDERGGDNSWNGDGIAASAIREADRWTATVVLPFAGFGVAPANGDEWRVNVCRSRAAAFERCSWSPVGGGFHNPSAFGIVRFSDAPCPFDFSWKLTPPGKGRVKFAWPEGSNVAVVLDGKRLSDDGVFSYSPLKDNKLVLEGKSKGVVVFRTTLPIPADLVERLVRDAERSLEGLNSAKAAAIQSELDAFCELLAHTVPERKALFIDAIANLAARARNVRAAADFAALGRPADEITYGVETSLVKLLKNTPFKGEIGGTVRLDAARNEMDAAQVVLFAGDAGWISANAKVDGDLLADGGEVLPASALRLRRVGYVLTKKPVYPTEHVGLWPDPLMELSSFDVSAHSFETIWIDVRIPEGQKPALYRGSVELTAMNGDPTMVPVEVRVRNFTIPKASSLTTMFGDWPRRWRVAQDRDAYFDNFLEHRISPNGYAGGPKLVSPPMLDWGNARKLSVAVTPHLAAELRTVVAVRDCPAVMLPAKVLPAGKPTIVEFGEDQIALTNVLSATFTVALTDSAALEASVTFADGSVRTLVPASDKAASSVDGWLRNWPVWQVEAWRQPDRPAVFDWTDFDAKFEKALAKGITSHGAALGKPYGLWAAEFQRHLSGKGWLQYFYTYLFDEPEPKHYKEINRTLSQIKEAEPGTLKNMVTARSFPPELPFIDIWCPEIYTYSPSLSAAEQRKGREVWWYPAFTTHHPFPNVFIDYPALDCRILPWLTWKHNLDGLFYWNVTCWRQGRKLVNPWAVCDLVGASNGDGSILYPGNDGRPVDTIRWECLRDGMEDYEVFCLLEAAAHELGDTHPELVARIKGVCAIDDSVVASYRKFNPDPAALLDARRKMSSCLEEVVAVLGHEPTIVGRPRRRRGVTQEEARAAIAKMKEQDAAAKPLCPQPQPSVEPKDGLRLLYKFDSDLPYLFDYSGNGRHAIPVKAKRIDSPDGMAIQLVGGGYVPLSAGADLLGSQPTEGTIKFMVRPDFDPANLVGAKNGKDLACLFYLQKSSGNSLPDGYNEIGLYIKNDHLRLRLDGNWTEVGSVPVQFKKGQWHSVAIVWKPGERSLYIDGKRLIHNTSPYKPPQLDGFGGALGVHPPHKAFPFYGAFDNLEIWARALDIENVGL